MSSSLNASSNVSSKELRRRDFILNGNLWKVIIVISLPLFLYSILNYVNDVIDNFMCASISSAAVSASASLSQVKNMVSAIGGGLSMLWNVGSPVPSGGMFIVPAMTNPLGFLAALGIGTVVCAGILVLTKKDAVEENIVIDEEDEEELDLSSIELN